MIRKRQTDRQETTRGEPSKVVEPSQRKVEPLLSGHPRDLLKCPLYRGCPLNKGFEIVKRLLTINIQRFLYTVIKFQVVNQAVLNSSSLPTSMFFVCMDLALFNRVSFKDVTEFFIVNSVRCPLNRSF